MSPAANPTATAIAEFAKTNKVSKAKVFEFVQKIESLQPKRNASTGRQVSDESMKIRESIRKMARDNPGVSIISSELAQRLDVGPSALNNNMRALAAEGVVEMAGHLKDTGRRGRAPVIWKFLGTKQ